MLDQAYLDKLVDTINNEKPDTIRRRIERELFDKDADVLPVFIVGVTPDDFDATSTFAGILIGWRMKEIASGEEMHCEK